MESFCKVRIEVEGDGWARASWGPWLGLSYALGVLEGGWLGFGAGGIGALQFDTKVLTMKLVTGFSYVVLANGC